MLYSKRKGDNLYYRILGILIKEMRLAHIKDYVHVLIDLGLIMCAHARNKCMRAGIKIEIDL